MIVITGEIEMHPEDAWPAASAALKMMEAAANEEGCLFYKFYSDLLNPRVFRVYEEWRDEETLAAHFKTPHMADFQAKLKQLRITDRKIKKFVVPSGDAP